MKLKRVARVNAKHEAWQQNKQELEISPSDPTTRDTCRGMLPLHLLFFFF
jgi:hypothetical protein